MRAVIVLTILVTGATAARADRMWKLPPMVGVKEVTATSTFADKKDRYAAWRAVAYDERSSMAQPEPVLWSAWCEGKKGEGLGETVTIRLAEPTRIDAVRIAAGVWRTSKLFAANNQITALSVIADGKVHAIKPSGRRWAEVAIGATVSTIAVRIDKVKKGKMNDSCLSGIDLMRGGKRLPPVIGVDAKAVAALQPTVDAIQRALEKPDRKGLEPLIELPFSNENADMAMGYGGGEAITSRTWKDLAAACARLPAEREASDGDPTSTGCPEPVTVDEDDDRPPGVTTLAPGQVELSWPSGREVVVTWGLTWTDRWRLHAIGYTAF